MHRPTINEHDETAICGIHGAFYSGYPRCPTCTAMEKAVMEDDDTQPAPMTTEQKESQRQNWVQGEAAMNEPIQPKELLSAERPFTKHSDVVSWLAQHGFTTDPHWAEVIRLFADEKLEAAQTALAAAQEREREAKRLLAKVLGEFQTNVFQRVGSTPVDGSKDTRWMKEAEAWLLPTPPDTEATNGK